jgi:hypothetical protein
MFFIEYAEGVFVDAEKIVTVWFNSHKAGFTVQGGEEEYLISADMADTFFNNLQALNKNINSVETAYSKAQKLDTSK